MSTRQEASSRARLAPLMFAALVRYDHLFGQVDHLPGFTAVASWMRPGEATESAGGLAQAGFGDLPDDVPLGSLEAVFGFIGAAVRNAAPERRWHLRLLAADPDHQGRGLGAVLLRHGLDRAADTGHPVVLETFAERAVPFYLRNGFEFLVDGVEPASGLSFWALCHMPRG
jgi:GNAT superfamily N-acetyltransferase